MIYACKRCKYGIAAKDGEVAYFVCALLPPVNSNPSRPMMKPNGWCGQFRLSLLRLIGYGPRA